MLARSMKLLIIMQATLKCLQLISALNTKHLPKLVFTDVEKISYKLKKKCEGAAYRSRMKRKQEEKKEIFYRQCMFSKAYLKVPKGV